jgi:hypothetical protein
VRALMLRVGPRTFFASFFAAFFAFFSRFRRRLDSSESLLSLSLSSLAFRLLPLLEPPLGLGGSSPQFSITTSVMGRSRAAVGDFYTALIRSKPSTTRPKTTCFAATHTHATSTVRG